MRSLSAGLTSHSNLISRHAHFNAVHTPGLAVATAKVISKACLGGFLPLSGSCRGGASLRSPLLPRSSALGIFRLAAAPSQAGKCRVGFSWLGRERCHVTRCAAAAGPGGAVESTQHTQTTVTTETVGSDDPPFMTGDEIRSRFLRFFESKGHKRVPSSSLIPEDPTVLLTIAGMLQFKPVFMGQRAPTSLRATSSQKCIRTNDVENVGRTARHHTFFEMLGNFSFGDYFKKEAILWAWELATQVFKLSPDRVWVSVFEEDDEALAIWRDQVGVPAERILRMTAKDNFWASGATGPCGPCSELYYDFHPERGTQGADLEDDTRFMEFYNLVFMQFNRQASGDLLPLANKNIDTGMGLERMAQILQKVPNNYETDLIMPIIQEAAALAGINYQQADEKQKRYLKVIGDHTRAVVYMISDGVRASNVGRGYVLRRLIRRTVRMGRMLGIPTSDEAGRPTAFSPKVAAVVVKLAAAVDPSVPLNAPKVYAELAREELRFVETLSRGEKLLEELLEQAAGLPDGKRVISGRDAFILYDTYGFPFEITEEVGAERGVAVDGAGFQEEMGKQRASSKAAHQSVVLTLEGATAELVEQAGKTEFVGYEELTSESTVLALLVDGKPMDEVDAAQGAAEGVRVDVVLDRSPFYAESGGQVGDKGVMELLGEEGQAGVLGVQDCKKIAGSLFLHAAVLRSGAVRVGAVVSARVDPLLRRRARCHHTATHLLQSALKAVLGDDVAQAGSLVDFDRLRFDFNLPRAMTPEELQRVEDLVNGWINEGHPTQTTVMELEAAKAAGATAMFGEKYDAQVRVVSLPGVSMELCGGTHVSNAAEIGGFRIISEGGIASGVRRIEAVAGPAVMDYLKARDDVVRQLTGNLRVRVDELPQRIAGLQDEIMAARKEMAALKAGMALAKLDTLAAAASSAPNGTRYVVETLDDVDAESLKLVAERLLQKLGDPAAVVLGSVPEAGKVSIIAALSPAVLKSTKLQAGKFVGAVAKICNGGGGGRPNLAQAGGKSPEQLPAAMAFAREELLKELK
eukprot:jgi/Mesvir1/2661/Mv16266-RA.2